VNIIHQVQTGLLNHRSFTLSLVLHSLWWDCSEPDVRRYNILSKSVDIQWQNCVCDNQYDNSGENVHEHASCTKYL